MSRKKQKIAVPERIQKLVALASHDGTPQHERENAAMLACKLLSPMVKASEDDEGDAVHVVEPDPDDRPLRYVCVTIRCRECGSKGDVHVIV